MKLLRIESAGVDVIDECLMFVPDEFDSSDDADIEEALAEVHDLPEPFIAEVATYRAVVGCLRVDTFRPFYG